MSAKPRDRARLTDTATLPALTALKILSLDVVDIAGRSATTYAESEGGEEWTLQRLCNATLSRPFYLTMIAYGKVMAHANEEWVTYYPKSPYAPSGAFTNFLPIGVRNRQVPEGVPPHFLKSGDLPATRGLAAYPFLQWIRSEGGDPGSAAARIHLADVIQDSLETLDTPAILEATIGAIREQFLMAYWAAQLHTLKTPCPAPPGTIVFKNFAGTMTTNLLLLENRPEKEVEAEWARVCKDSAKSKRGQMENQTIGCAYTKWKNYHDGKTESDGSYHYYSAGSSRDAYPVFLGFVNSPNALQSSAYRVKRPRNEGKSEGGEQTEQEPLTELQEAAKARMEAQAEAQRIAKEKREELREKKAKQQQIIDEAGKARDESNQSKAERAAKRRDLEERLLALKQES